MSWSLENINSMIISKKGGKNESGENRRIFETTPKKKGLTQEQLAEQFLFPAELFHVGRQENMPDLSILVELAVFYNVDIREIIDGERKSETMNCNTKDTLKKLLSMQPKKRKI